MKKCLFNDIFYGFMELEVSICKDFEHVSTAFDVSTQRPCGSVVQYTLSECEKKPAVMMQSILPAAVGSDARVNMLSGPLPMTCACHVCPKGFVLGCSNQTNCPWADPAVRLFSNIKTHFF